MLGNFSFGDYFKRDAIRWAYELAVEKYRLDPERIWVTVYTDDDETAGIWLEETDIPAERIQRLGADDNYWWTHAAGPGGPNTEMYYDRGDAYGRAGGPAVNDERYLEFYNLVFMQHALDDDGTILGELPAKNVDTGLGLERMAVLLQGVDNVFETDLFRPLIAKAEQLTNVTYGADANSDVSLRVLAEHARTSAFLLADGVLPAKDGRGYVLRRLLRRALRHGQLLGVDVTEGTAVLLPMIETVIDTLSPLYPELAAQHQLITRIVAAEERDFGARLRSGLARIDTLVDTLKPGDQLSGEAAFELHDTYGFPIDLTLEIAEDQGLSVDRDRFVALMEEQRERARKSVKRGGDGVSVDVYRDAMATLGATTFVGYDELHSEAAIGALLTADGLLHEASEGDEVEVLLARTPFYAEGGGQVGDRGIIETDTGRLEVLDTQPALDGVITHRARVIAGEIRPGQNAQASVDVALREATARSHSATHMLHATIKELLGSHAQQAGSLVSPGRLRFDFPHFAPVSSEELAQIEHIVNARVLADPHVTTEVMSLADAKNAGAVANFGDKYGEIVRVVTIGSFSKELCGGTHASSGSRIGTIAVVKEESIGSNTRRIEALTGEDALTFLGKERIVAQDVARLLDVPTDDAVERVQSLMKRLRDAEKQLTTVREANLARQAETLAKQAQSHDGMLIVTHREDGLSADELRSLALSIRNQLSGRAAVIVGALSSDAKAALVAAITQNMVDDGVSAKDILADAANLVGGGAGGKGDVAQAGGRDGSKLDEALRIAVNAALTKGSRP
jgi:alanyl-tRNA synthetase